MCTTRCFNAALTGCTCTFNSGLFWVATQSPITSYYCSRILLFLNIAVTSINFSFYNSVTIPNISVPANNEISLEFWAYIYTYVPGTFTSLDVMWDKQARIQIIYTGGSLKANCFPFVDITNLSSYTTSMQDSMVVKTWYYLRCAVNTFTKKYFINSFAQQPYTPFPTFTASNTTSLQITDNMSLANWNYGFSFIRELKLLSNYPFQFWDPSRM